MELLLNPNDRQKEFFLEREKFILYGGAKGGGKSWALRWKQILRRLNYPKSKGLLLRRTYPQLYRTHIDKMLTEMPKGIAEYKPQSHSFHFLNGSVLELGSAQHESDILNYQGAEYDDIGIDQAEQFTEYQFDMIRSILRSVRPDLDTQLYVSANPGGVGHGWVKRKFITEPDAGYRYIPAKVYDNPVLMQNDPQYVKDLERLPDELRRAYLEGDWDVFAGQVFGEWRREKHIITEFAYPIDSCHRIMTYDWGYNAPACALWLAFTPDRRIYVYREIYQNSTTPEKWAEQLAIINKVDPVEQFVLPHDCFARLGGRESIADTFTRAGIAPIKQANTLTRDARKNRLAILHNFLADGADGIPLLQVHVNCKNTIRTLPELIYDQSNPEDVDTSGEDHAYDALSIGVSAALGNVRGSGAVKVEPSMNLQVQQRRIHISDDGTLPAPDFWTALKNTNGKPRRTWETG